MHTRWRRLSAAQLRELWALWKQGQTFAAIGQALARPLDSVYGVVARHGGIPPRERRRAAGTSSKRESIRTAPLVGIDQRAKTL